MEQHLPQRFHKDVQQAIVQCDAIKLFYYVVQMLYYYTRTLPLEQQAEMMQTKAVYVAREMAHSARNATSRDKRLLDKLPEILKDLSLADILLVSIATVAREAQRYTHIDLIETAMAESDISFYF